MKEERTLEQTRWHRFLAKGFELSVGQRGVLVLAEVEVSRNPPKVDILLLRRETENWTPEQMELLPDGIRDTSMPLSKPLPAGQRKSERHLLCSGNLSSCRAKL